MQHVISAVSPGIGQPGTPISRPGARWCLATQRIPFPAPPMRARPAAPARRLRDMVTRRPVRLAALALLGLVLAISAGTAARPSDDGRAAISAVADVAVAHAAVPDPARPLLPLVPAGPAAALVLAALAWMAATGLAGRPATDDPARRRWRSRLVGAPPAARIA